MAYRHCGCNMKKLLKKHIGLTLHILDEIIAFICKFKPIWANKFVHDPMFIKCI